MAQRNYLNLLSQIFPENKLPLGSESGVFGSGRNSVGFHNFNRNGDIIPGTLAIFMQSTWGFILRGIALFIQSDNPISCVPQVCRVVNPAFKEIPDVCALLWLHSSYMKMPSNT